MAGEEGCNSGFECNICLDMAKKPVVTACGHLFCWPCLYPWLRAQAPFPECPVCKGEILQENITPIYGRGSEEEEYPTTANPNLPPRPQANRRESFRQQMQTAGTDVRQLESEIMRMIRNQRVVGNLPTPAGTEMTSVNAAQVNLAAPQQPSSVEQQPTSSTAAAIEGEPGPASRRSRRSSEDPAIRSTRRRPQ